MVRERSDAGAAAVELALVLPVLLLLLFGMVDFGRLYHTNVALAHAAREGVRAVALNEMTNELDASGNCKSPPRGPRCRAEAAASGLPLQHLTVTPPVGCTPTSNAQLVLSYQFTYVTPLAGVIALIPGSTNPLSNPVKLEAKGVMRCGG